MSRTPIQQIIADPNVSPAFRGTLLDRSGLYTDISGSLDEYVPTEDEQRRMAIESKADEDSDRQREDDAGINDVR